MDAELAGVYGNLYRNHWWFRSREMFLVEQIAALTLPNPPRILDVGCGSGWFFESLEKFSDQLFGIETDAKLIEQSASKKVPIHHGQLDDSYKPSESFDLILMLDVIEHIQDDVSVLRRAAELLSPDGVILLTVPAFRFLWTSHDVINHHFRRYSTSSLRRSATAAGLTASSCEYFFHWLVPIKLAMRGKEIIFGASNPLPKLPSSSMNRIGYSISRFEQRFLRALRLPFGTSLLAVLKPISRFAK